MYQRFQKVCTSERRIQLEDPAVAAPAIFHREVVDWHVVGLEASVYHAAFRPYDVVSTLPLGEIGQRCCSSVWVAETRQSAVPEKAKATLLIRRL